MAWPSDPRLGSYLESFRPETVVKDMVNFFQDFRAETFLICTLYKCKVTQRSVPQQSLDQIKFLTELCVMRVVELAEIFQTCKFFCKFFGNRH